MNTLTKLNLETVEKTISTLLHDRIEVIKELKKLRDERKMFILTNRELSDNLWKIRKKISDDIDKIKIVTSDRYNLVNDIRESRSKIKEATNKFKNTDSNIRNIAPEELQNTVSKLEWRLQAERLTREEEKEIVANIKEIHLKTIRVKNRMNQDLNIKAFSDNVSTISINLDANSENRRELQKNITIQKDDIKRLRKQQTENNKRIENSEKLLVDGEDKLEIIYRQLDDLKSSRRGIIEEKQRITEDKFRKKEEEAIGRIKDEVKDKLAEGKKIPLEELKLFYNQRED